MWSLNCSLVTYRWPFAMLFAFTAMLTGLPTEAAEWSLWPIKDSSSVGAGFKQDSAGHF